jgi:hypothetical protein
MPFSVDTSSMYMMRKTINYSARRRATGPMTGWRATRHHGWTWDGAASSIAEAAAAAANDALEHGKELATDAANQTAAAVSTLAKAWDGLHGIEAATYLGKRAEAAAAAATAAASDALERVFKEVATDAADHTAAAFSSAFRKAWDKLHGSEAATHLGKRAEAAAAAANDALERGTTDEKNEIVKRLDEAKKEYNEFGWRDFANGNWLGTLIERSFKTYFERANGEYFRKKYPNLDIDSIAKKLVEITAKNAAILGAISGASVSTSEIIGIFTTLETAGIADIAMGAAAISAICGEAILLVRFQLQLVAELAKLFDVPLDLNDPEDVQTMLAFGLGGSASETLGNLGGKLTGGLTKTTVKTFASGGRLKFIQSLARPVGIKILQRNIVKYAVPGASIGVGVCWNYVATRTFGRIAIKHLNERLLDKQRLLASHALEQDAVKGWCCNFLVAEPAAMTARRPENCPNG